MNCVDCNECFEIDNTGNFVCMHEKNGIGVADIEDVYSCPDWCPLEDVI